MSHHESSRRLLAPSSLLFGSVFVLVACGPSGKDTQSTSSEAVVDGQLQSVILDPNEAGLAQTVTLEEVRWGRLVDVYDEENRDGDPATHEVRTLQRRDFLIGQAVSGDDVLYRLRTNPLTQRTELTILADADGDYVAPFDSIEQSRRFEILFDAIADSAEFLPVKGTGATAVPPFPVVPRNAAFSLRFSDLLDAGSITSDTVRLTTGVPPVFVTPARIFADPNHGAFLNGVRFTTRVLVDPAITEVDASGTVLVVNAQGMPPGPATGSVSGALRVPTSVAPAVGQFQVLRNLSGHAVRFTNNGPNEPNTTLDVVRSFRPGRATDANNGFLADFEPPRLRGTQSVALLGAPVSVPPDAALGEVALGPEPDRVFLVDLDFVADACAPTPRLGDLLTVNGISVPNVHAEVTRVGTPPQSGVASDVRLRVLHHPRSSDLDVLVADFLAATGGSFETTFVPGPGVSGECFLAVSPQPEFPPTTGISTQPRITLRFSEPIDPASIRPFDNLRLVRTTGPVTPTDLVVGEVTHSPDLREFRFTPSLPLDHRSADPDSDRYFFNLAGGLGGVTDLAGNPIVDTLPPDVPLTVASSAFETSTGGFALRFHVVNEFGNLEDDTDPASDPAPEVRGQLLRDEERGVIFPREVVRMSQVIDPSTAPTYNFFPNLTPIPQSTPISPMGSRLMTVYRYCDVGFGILDEETANVDVEGLSWMPAGTSVLTDFFPQFEISLSHSDRLPDEVPVLGQPVAAFPNSGLLGTFDDNVLVDPDSVRRVVHPRSRGYLLDPSQQFTSSIGTRMMPYPLGRQGGGPDFEYFTWRDTAITGVGGPDGGGAEVGGHLLAALLGLPGAPCLDASNTPQGGVFSSPPTVYPVNQVRSLGLPLLVEFKCFAGQGSGLNALASVQMGGPAFRAYSTGGNGADTLPVLQNPDAEPVASGSVNLGSPGTDSVAYPGQLDVVTRISRVHTRWFDTEAVAAGFPVYGQPVIEPKPTDQPLGTAVLLAFRGAHSVVGTDDHIANANLYDAYGDPLNRIFVTDNMGTCTDPTDDEFEQVTADIAPSFFNGDASWTSDLSELVGARWIQIRITFVSNAETGERPELSTLALPFVRG